MMTIGERIRQERLKYGMSQAELARRIRISPTAMNDIELGRVADPRFSVVEAIAATLGRSLDTFAGLSPRLREQPVLRDVAGEE